MPFAARAELVFGCPPGFVIRAKPSEVAPPPSVESQSRWLQWGEDEEGVLAAPLSIHVTLEGLEEQVVVLWGLKARVVARHRLDHAASYSLRPCGGVIDRRVFSVMLDRHPPKVRAWALRGQPVEFPLEISKTDPEVLALEVQSSRCDCAFELRLRWSSGDREGTETIRLRDGPFQIAGTGRRRSSYFYDRLNERWIG